VVGSISDLAFDAALLGNFFEPRVDDAEAGTQIFDRADLAVTVEVVSVEAARFVFGRLAAGGGRLVSVLRYDSTIPDAVERPTAALSVAGGSARR